MALAKINDRKPVPWRRGVMHFHTRTTTAPPMHMAQSDLRPNRFTHTHPHSPHLSAFTPAPTKILNSELIPSPRGAVVSEWPHATVVSPGCEIPVGSKTHTPPPVRSLALIGTSSRVI